jgi:excisionase family DNA binding protein
MSLNSQTQERRALSIREAARTCGLSRATIYRLIADGKLATSKIGARRLVPVSAIDALLREGA